MALARQPIQTTAHLKNSSSGGQHRPPSAAGSPRCPGTPNPPNPSENGLELENGGKMATNATQSCHHRPQHPKTGTKWDTWLKVVPDTDDGKDTGRNGFQRGQECTNAGALDAHLQALRLAERFAKNERTPRKSLFIARPAPFPSQAGVEKKIEKGTACARPKEVLSSAFFFLLKSTKILEFFRFV